MNIPLSKPCTGNREARYVGQVLRSGRLSLGPMLEEFERRFAAYVGARYAIAVNSGTSALHLCVKALGIGPADEVLTTSFSFAASTNCFLYEGATPAFADIDPVTLNIDPLQVREIIERDYAWDRARRCLVNRASGRTLKAILPVHVFGLPCDMAPLMEIAREFRLAVIEDACEAFGAEYHGQHVGTFGNAGAFAFYPNKQITTAEGGMIVTNDPSVAKLCRSLRNQGRSEDADWLCHVHLGYNYRLSELHCALGVAQMERAEEIRSARERVAALYRKDLSRVSQIALPAETASGRRSWFAYVIRLRLLGRPGASCTTRDWLMRRLQENGVACQAYFPAIHRQPYIRGVMIEPERPLPATEHASETCLALPFFTTVNARQVEKVCATVRAILRDTEDTVNALQSAQRDDRTIPVAANGD